RLVDSEDSGYAGAGPGDTQIPSPEPTQLSDAPAPDPRSPRCPHPCVGCRTHVRSHPPAATPCTPQRPVSEQNATATTPATSTPPPPPRCGHGTEHPPDHSANAPDA